MFSSGPLVGSLIVVGALLFARSGSPEETKRPANDGVEAERKLKTRDLQPKARRAPIDVSGLGLMPRVPIQRVPSPEKLAIVELPVLLPNDAALLEVAIVTANPNWYGVSMTRSGVNVYVSGRRIEFEVPGVEPGPARAEPSITRNELAVHLSFSRFGASYTIAVECARPSEDARCLDDAYALGLHRSMAWAGARR